MFFIIKSNLIEAKKSVESDSNCEADLKERTLLSLDKMIDTLFEEFLKEINDNFVKIRYSFSEIRDEFYYFEPHTEVLAQVLYDISYSLHNS